MTGKTIRIALAVGLALLLALGAVGCATTGQEAKARRLNSNEAEKLLGYQRARQGNPEAETDPEADSQTLEARGDGLALAGSWEAALFQYNRALTLADQEQRIRLLGKAAQIHLKARDFAQAENLFATTVKEDPSSAQAWQGLGLARLSMGQHQGAADALVRALALRPDFWKSANALGIIHNHWGEPDKALALFSQALSAAPSSAEIYNNRGLAYLLSHQKALAEADFNRALSLKPDFELAHNNLALLMAKDGRYVEAFSAFKRGTGQAQAHNNLGCLLAWRGDDQKAAEHFDQALKDMPRYYPLAGTHLEQLKIKDGEGRLSRISGSLPMVRPQAISRTDKRENVSPKAQAKPAKTAASAPETTPKTAPVARAAQAAPASVKADGVKVGHVSREAKPKPAAAPAPAPTVVAVDRTTDSELTGGAVLARPKRPLAQAGPPPAFEQAEAEEALAAAPVEKPAVAEQVAQAPPQKRKPVLAQDLGFSNGPVIARRDPANTPAAEEPLVRLRAKPAEHPGVWRGTIPPQAQERGLSRLAWDQGRPAFP